MNCKTCNKKIKDTKQPNLVSKPLYKDIRLSNPSGGGNGGNGAAGIVLVSWLG